MNCCELLCMRLALELGVRSQHLMVRIWPEAFGLSCPAFAYVFVRGETAKGLQSPAVVVCVNEVIEVCGHPSIVAWKMHHQILGLNTLELSIGSRLLRTDLRACLDSFAGAGRTILKRVHVHRHSSLVRASQRLPVGLISTHHNCLAGVAPLCALTRITWRRAVIRQLCHLPMVR